MTDASFYSGEDIRLELTILDSDTSEAMPLDGVEIEFKLFRHDGNQIVKTVSNGINVVDANAGRCNIDLEPSDTSGVVFDTTMAYAVQVVRDGHSNIVRHSSIHVKRNLMS